MDEQIEIMQMKSELGNREFQEKLQDPTPLFKILGNPNQAARRKEWSHSKGIADTQNNLQAIMEEIKLAEIMSRIRKEKGTLLQKNQRLEGNWRWKRRVTYWSRPNQRNIWRKRTFGQQKAPWNRLVRNSTGKCPRMINETSRTNQVPMQNHSQIESKPSQWLGVAISADKNQR